MADKTKHGWTVVDGDAGVLALDYNFDAKGKANGFAMRAGDGRMVVISPPKGLDDGAYEDVAELGEVGTLVSNNGFHYLGQKAWRERFPDASAYATPGAAARIAKKSKHPLSYDALSELSGSLGERCDVRQEPADGARESWAWAESDGGAVWYVSDILNNMESFSGPLPLRILYNLTKSGPGYSVFHLALMATAKHKKSLLRSLLEDMRAHPPKAIVFAHGPMLARDGLADETFEILERAL